MILYLSKHISDIKEVEVETDKVYYWVTVVSVLELDQHPKFRPSAPKPPVLEKRGIPVHVNLKRI